MKNDTPEIKALNNLPLNFEANIGQKDEQVKFLARGREYTAFFTSTEVVLVLLQHKPENGKLSNLKPFAWPKIGQETEQQSCECSVLKLKVEGTNPNTEIIGEEKLEGKINYFKGNDPEKWVTDIPSYKKIRYKDAYQGIDLVYYWQARQLEHDFIVKPGADPEKISLSIEGAERIEVDEEGNLLIKVKTGELRLLKPKVYQEINGAKQEIECAYKVSAEGKVGFNLGGYNRSTELKIDPVLDYSTYLGGSDQDDGTGIAIDEAGNAYVIGYTYSLDFPTTAGAYETTLNDGIDVFITKLNASGTGLVYSTFLGGTGGQIGLAIEVDTAGNAYVTGATFSPDFPTTAGAYDTTFRGVVDVFVTKLNASGTGLVYSTFIGGSDYEEGDVIAIDAAGNAYVSGFTRSLDFPTTAGAYDTTLNDGVDVFVTKLNVSGTGLVYSTFIGGSDYEESRGIAIDAAGNAYITGFTYSSDFPTTAGAYDTTFRGSKDVFITKLNASGTGLIYSTFIGGSGDFEEGHGIAIDADGYAYVTGYTRSSDFPTTAGAYDTTFRGVGDVFVTKLNANGTGLVYSTFIGGSGYEEGHGIAVDAAGNAYITGHTQSSDFPTTAGAYDTSFRGGEDVFVTKLNAGGTGLIYSTFIGGSNYERGHGIAVDAAGNAYITGFTYSSDFPTTAGAYDTTSNGARDAFVIKLVFNSQPQVLDYDVTTPEDTPVSGTVVGTDADGDALIYSLLDSSVYGIAVVNPDGSWTYTPGSNYYGTDSFTVEVNDGHGGTAVSTINITITPVNDPPIIGDYNVTTPEDTPISGAVVGTDVDGDPLTYSLFAGPSHGAAVVNSNGSWIYTPSANYYGPDSFTVEVNDGHGGTAVSTINITVTPVNDVPTVDNYDVTTLEDTPISGAVVGTDPDGDTLTYTLSTSALHGIAVVNTNGYWTYTPALNYHGSDNFTVEVNDGHGGTAVSTINIIVTPVNDAPTVGDYNVTTPEDTPISGVVVGTDVDGDPLTYSLLTGPLHGTAVVNPNGSWIYTPAANYYGADSFTVKVDDGHGRIAVSSINITITQVNNPPIVPASYNVTAFENTPVGGTVVGTDPDGDALTYSLLSGANHGTALVSPGGAWTYTPNPGFKGTDAFAVLVSDGHGGTAISTINITVIASNNPPSVPNYDVTTPKNTPISGIVVGSDPDNDPLTYSLKTGPYHGTAVVNLSGGWTYTPAVNYFGADSFIVQVSDGHGGIAESTVNITVTYVNTPPNVPDYNVTTKENTQISGTVVGSDPDGDQLTYSLLTNAHHGRTMVSTNGRWTYNPNPGFFGTDMFKVIVSDRHGGTAISTVRVTVSPQVNFKQFNMSESVIIPESKPDIEEIIGVSADMVIKQTKVVSSPVGTSLEGQHLTGYKLVVSGIVILKIQYIADNPQQSVHAAHFEVPFATFVILPDNYVENTPIGVEGYIEDIYTSIIDERTIFNNITILIETMDCI